MRAKPCCAPKVVGMLFLVCLTLTQGLFAADWIPLFDGKSLSGWRLRHEGGRNGWRVEDGVLINQPPSTDLVSEQRFGDFQLHIEFIMPRGSNSGVYLQGRYEIQLLDSHGAKPESHMCGGIYGLLPPRFNASKPAGEWQVFDVKFVQARRSPDGKIVRRARVTVIHNGVTIHENAEIARVTGGALDGNEGTPGPLMLQGDHGPVHFRNIYIRPLTEEEAESPHMFPPPPGTMAYKPLFDGESLKGWRILKTGHGTGGKWEVVDGVLQGTQDPPGNGGVLATVEKYGNFEIVAEIKPDFGIDSGLFLRTTEDGRCYQVTIDYRDGGQVGTLYGEGCGGWLAPNERWKEVWRENDWNLLRAIVVGQPPRIRVWLNERLLVDFTDKEERLPTEGFIGLQVHGGGDWQGKLTRFRNIRILTIE
ncbi:MAG: hypothetical protein GDYSWBUE_001241 [Candidatus Fervidibacterota bacterium]